VGTVNLSVYTGVLQLEDGVKNHAHCNDFSRTALLSDNETKQLNLKNQTEYYKIKPTKILSLDNIIQYHTICFIMFYYI